MNELNTIESAVLKKLLEGSHPVLEALNSQLDNCQVKKRELTGVGFFTEMDISPSVSKAPVSSKKIYFGDVIAEVEGLKNGIGFLLYIVDGQIQMLEGYTFDEPWPDIIKHMELKFTSQSRDF